MFTFMPTSKYKALMAEALKPENAFMYPCCIFAMRVYFAHNNRIGEKEAAD
jgi:hypothetical protein